MDDLYHCEAAFDAPTGKVPGSRDVNGFGSTRMLGLGDTLLLHVLEARFPPLSLLHARAEDDGRHPRPTQGQGQEHGTSSKSNCWESEEECKQVYKGIKWQLCPCPQWAVLRDQSLWWHMSITKDSQQHQSYLYYMLPQISD